jgi:epoxyqueuosine reductase QueG
MILEDLKSVALDFMNTPMNTISNEKPLKKSIAGMKIFEEILFGTASPTDSYLLGINKNTASGLTITEPLEWLSGAKTVVSFFLRYTDHIRKSNRGGNYPSLEWLHGRIDVQNFIAALSRHLEKFLILHGCNTVVPLLDERFSSFMLQPDENGPLYTSNWSERHAAYAAGLGTFSLSKGIITKLGSAGRLGSLITELELPITERDYTAIYEYCTKCGACARKCPVNAISLAEGKDNIKCGEFLRSIRKALHPYYGCAKCQTGVPCEAKLPQIKGIGKITPLSYRK